MARRYPGDYQPQAPWGKDGDRKNDGYLKSERQLFQCYAPRELAQQPTVTKIAEDFAGALPHWEKYFGTWVFVHNVIPGTPAFVTEELLRLESAHRPLRLIPWGYHEVSARALELPRTDLVALLGAPVSEEGLASLSFQDIAVVVDTIACKATPPDSVVRPVPANKLSANQLSNSVESFLRVGMRKADLVGQFFANWYDVTLGDRTARAFKERYTVVKAAGHTPDEIFSDLWVFAGNAPTNALYPDS